MRCACSSRKAGSHRPACRSPTNVEECRKIPIEFAGVSWRVQLFRLRRSPGDATPWPLLFIHPLRPSPLPVPRVFRRPAHQSYVSGGVGSGTSGVGAGYVSAGHAQDALAGGVGGGDELGGRAAPDGSATRQLVCGCHIHSNRADTVRRADFRLVRDLQAVAGARRDTFPQTALGGGRRSGRPHRFAMADAQRSGEAADAGSARPLRPCAAGGGAGVATTRIGRVLSGLHRQIARDVPFRTIQLLLFEDLRERWERNHGRALTSGENVLVGAIAGSLTATITNPLDVVRTRLQTQGEPGARKYRGMWAAFRSVAIEEGARGLFAGVRPRVLFHAPAGAVAWTTFEFVKRTLHLDENLEALDERTHHGVYCGASGTTPARASGVESICVRAAGRVGTFPSGLLHFILVGGGGTGEGAGGAAAAQAGSHTHEGGRAGGGGAAGHHRHRGVSVGGGERAALLLPRAPLRGRQLSHVSGGGGEDAQAGRQLCVAGDGGHARDHRVAAGEEEPRDGAGVSAQVAPAGLSHMAECERAIRQLTAREHHRGRQVLGTAHQDGDDALHPLHAVCALCRGGGRRGGYRHRRARRDDRDHAVPVGEGVRVGGERQHHRPVSGGRPDRQAASILDSQRSAMMHRARGVGWRLRASAFELSLSERGAAITEVRWRHGCGHCSVCRSASGNRATVGSVRRRRQECGSPLRSGSGGLSGGDVGWKLGGHKAVPHLAAAALVQLGRGQWNAHRTDERLTAQRTAAAAGLVHVAHHHVLWERQHVGLAGLLDERLWPATLPGKAHQVRSHRTGLPPTRRQAGVQPGAHVDGLAQVAHRDVAHFANVHGDPRAPVRQRCQRRCWRLATKRRRRSKRRYVRDNTLWGGVDLLYVSDAPVGVSGRKGRACARAADFRGEQHGRGRRTAERENGVEGHAASVAGVNSTRAPALGVVQEIGTAQSSLQDHHMLASSDMFTRRLFLVVLGVALASLLALPAAALPAVRVESSSGGSHGNSSGGTIDVFYPPPSPALSPPPTYDLNRTATVVIAGADAISDFPPAFNFFGHGAAITFSGGAQYAAVYPNDDAGTYRLLNATELLQDLKFRYFVYYGHPLAQLNPLHRRHLCDHAGEHHHLRHTGRGECGIQRVRSAQRLGGAAPAQRSERLRCGHLHQGALHRGGNHVLKGRSVWKGVGSTLGNKRRMQLRRLESLSQCVRRGVRGALPWFSPLPNASALPTFVTPPPQHSCPPVLAATFTPPVRRWLALAPRRD
eukprot:ctg_281.g166